MGRTNRYGILKGDQFYGACISHIIRQRTKLKGRQHILRVIQHYLRRKIGTTQLESAKKKVETKIPQTQQ
jgi:hypothetical protein